MQAYWRRLLRSYVYYVAASMVGIYLLLTSFHSVHDLFFVFDARMSMCFCAAASHFLFNIYEDYKCRLHMGRTPKEVQGVYVGYVIHHLATAAAYLIINHQQQLGTTMRYTYAHAHTHAYMHAVPHMHDFSTHICACTHMHAYAHTHRHIRAHTDIRAHTQTYTDLHALIAIE